MPIYFFVQKLAFLSNWLCQIHDCLIQVFLYISRSFVLIIYLIYQVHSKFTCIFNRSRPKCFPIRANCLCKKPDSQKNFLLLNKLKDKILVANFRRNVNNVQHVPIYFFVQLLSYQIGCAKVMIAWSRPKCFPFRSIWLC